jgi:Domain of unknown function (DUF4439)
MAGTTRAGTARAGTARTGTARAGAPVEALQAALAAEDAASYGYGIVGAHLAGAAFGVATADCVIHERARDSLATMISALGATPQPAATAYRLPFPVGTARQAASLAVELELGVVAGYLRLVAIKNTALRTLATTRMQDAAVRAARWGGQPEAFPGLATPR